jgi:DNA-binding transcriptional regulator YbjK
MTSVRLTKDQRRSVIEQAAVKVANEDGLTAVNFNTVAEACGAETSKWTVKYYYPTKAALLSLVLSTDLPLMETVKNEAEILGIRS